jgi:mono/diheme cytochrome c family protein
LNQDITWVFLGGIVLITRIVPVGIILLCVSAGSIWAKGDAKRGEYLAVAANCVSCHTVETKGAVPYAGGYAIRTPFGIFYGPNITRHNEQGIGRWTESDFFRAMRFGVRPDGAAYFPAFPYLSYTMVMDNDLTDLWAYLQTIPPNNAPSRQHDLGILFSWRFPLRLWKWAFFTPGAFVPDLKQTQQINRGAYLVRALGHCSECHTPRNLLGVPMQHRFLAGGKGPDGKKVPNLTPAGLKKWSDKDLKHFMVTGLYPDGDVVGETMGIVIRNSTGKLISADLDAMIAYLRSLLSIENE